MGNRLSFLIPPETKKGAGALRTERISDTSKMNDCGIYVVKSRFLSDATGMIIDAAHSTKFSPYDQYHHAVVVVAVSNGSNDDECSCMEFDPTQFPIRDDGGEVDACVKTYGGKMDIIRNRYVVEIVKVSDFSFFYGDMCDVSRFLATYNMHNYYNGTYKYSIGGKEFVGSNKRNCQDFVRDLISNLKKNNVPMNGNEKSFV